MHTAEEQVTEPVGLLHAPLEACIRRELPHLNLAEVADLARIVATLVRKFGPERIYVFGSQARGTSTWHSDVDLLVIVPDAGEFPHHLEQAAYRAIGHHLLPLEIIFMSGDEFAWRAEVVSSLPATVLREGRTLYAAA
jgi:predicted nucleotidyltransferase